MTDYRTVTRKTQSVPTREGAGVKLRRAFGFSETPGFDPFLLLDDFRGDNPQDYLKGFPWHPHRGIETITYMLAGEVEHGDSMGNSGVIAAGDVQWMTAGSGIIHQEMPRSAPDGRMYGFQLWANLPRSHKMMPPRYQEIKSGAIPEVELPGGARARVICGQAGGVTGPVTDIMTDPTYLDLRLPAGGQYLHPVQPGHTALAYVYDGAGKLAGEGVSNHDLLLFGDGEAVQMAAGETGLRMLFISGRPLNEPVAWYGPIVMNTRAELETAFEEYRSGTFIKSGG